MYVQDKIIPISLIIYPDTRIFYKSNASSMCDKYNQLCTVSVYKRTQNVGQFHGVPIFDSVGTYIVFYIVQTITARLRTSNSPHRCENYLPLVNELESELASENESRSDVSDEAYEEDLFKTITFSGLLPLSDSWWLRVDCIVCSAYIGKLWISVMSWSSSISYVSEFACTRIMRRLTANVQSCPRVCCIIRSNVA